MGKLFIRVTLKAGNMGPGKAQLLELIDEAGSIRAAARTMKVSYRRAWLLLQETEALFGAPVLERHHRRQGRRRHRPDQIGPRHRQALSRD